MSRRDADGLPLVAAQPKSELATYSRMAAVSGPSGGGPSGSNKPMLTLFNPASSGKKIRLRMYGVQAESSSGTAVIVLYELRAITAHSGGTLLTPKKHHSTDGASVAECRSAPSSVTDNSDPVQTYILQSNTSQAPETYFRRLGVAGEQPLILEEGEGVVLHQVTSNGGVFHCFFSWTEE